ncbi:MAG: class III signal peptide-containing protein [Candidatus Micrarchaeota archaeon]
MFSKKGQVSTEYLVILAVVLVIALVVVYILSQSSSGVSSTLEKTSQAYWAGQSPIAVTGYKAATTTLTVTLKNVDAQKLTVTNIVGSGVTAYTTNVTLNVGEEKEVALTLPTACTSGAAYEYDDLVFTYAKGASTGLIEAGDKALVGKCT